MPPRIHRHKVFLSRHDSDRKYVDRFVEMMADHIVDRSVHDDDIDDRNLPIDEIRRRIRDDFIADATVTVVLIGPCTWQRKHVDWEISASLTDTRKNPRCGLLGLRLPSSPDFRNEVYDPHLIPPRLWDNCRGKDPFAKVYRWSGSTNQVNSIRRWIDQAFRRRSGTPPNNSRRQYRNNRRGNCSTGWQG